MRWALAALGLAIAAVVPLSLDRTRSRSFTAPERRAPDARPEERRPPVQRAAKRFPLDGPRTLGVTVVEKGSERPLADATVEVEANEGALELPLTDTGGETGLDGLADGLALRLRAQAPCYPKEVLWIRHTVRGDARLTLTVDPGRRLDWPVRAGAPPDGTPITFGAYPGVRLDPRAARGRIEGGALRSRGLPPGPIKAVAVAPDQSAFAIVTAAGREATGPPVTFVPPCTLLVRAVDRSGRPAPGIAFVLRNREKGRLATTDDHGRALFEGLLPLPAVLHMESLELRRVDLREGDVELEIPVEPEVEVLAECVVDGVATLPRGYRVRVHGRHVAAVPGPEPGTLRFRARPRGPYDPLRVTLTSEYGRHEAGARTGRVRFELGATGRLRVRGSDIPAQIQLERLAPEGWVHVDSYQRVLFDRLPPGRYRVRDRSSGEVSDPVDVRAGETASVVLETGATAWVSGRIVAPAGVNMAEVRIFVDGRGGHGGMEIDANRFRVRVPVRRPVELEARHPTLIPDGRVRVHGAQDGIVLRLRPGPRAVFRLDPEPLANAIRVALYAGPLDAGPARVIDLKRRGRIVVAIGGFAPGTYTFWVEVPGFRPFLRRDVVFGDGDTDLGTVRLERGAVLRFPPGSGRGMVTVTATHLGHPAYTRDAIGSLDRGLAITGLGKGRFRVVCTGHGRTGVFYDRTLDVDGESEYVLE